MQKAIHRQSPAETPQRAPLQAKTNSVKAIALMCMAIAFFSAIDATAKYLIAVSQLPMSQVVWVRFLGQFVAIVVALGLVAMPSLLRTKKLWSQLFRSTMLLTSTLFNFLALKFLRLDQTTTINFLTPLCVALLAGPVLGEWIGWRRFFAILVGFSGILVAVRPGFTAFEPAIVFSLLCVASYAAFSLLTRYLAPYDSSEVTLFYSLLVGTYVMAPFAIIDWVWPQDALTWVLVVTLGFWGALGHYIFIVAHRYAPASTLAPFIYLSLITHSAAGFMIFGHVPDGWTLAGAAIIIASGLYIIRREQIRKREADAALTRPGD
jgi:drug/metabolite transporter (DMT)-like permease